MPLRRIHARVVVLAVLPLTLEEEIDEEEAQIRGDPEEEPAVDILNNNNNNDEITQRSGREQMSHVPCKRTRGGCENDDDDAKTYMLGGCGERRDDLQLHDTHTWRRLWISVSRVII